MKYEPIYICDNGEIIKLHKTTPCIEYLDYIWVVSKTHYKAGRIVKHSAYKVQKFKGVYNTTRQITYPNSTKYFKNLQEALMYVSMQG